MICSICKEKEAIIFRKYSGEYLCLQCLKRSLEKRLRQTVGKYSLLKEEDKILLVLPGFETEKPSVELFLDMERNFPGVSISCLALSKSSIEIARGLGLQLEQERILTSLTRWDLIVDASKYAIQLSRNRDFTKIVIPLLLDDVVGLFLLGALRGYPPALVVNGRILLGDQIPEPPVITPFFRVPSEEIMLLIGKNWKPRDTLLKKIREIELEFPGSRFNILNSYLNLFLGRKRSRKPTG